MTEMQKMFDEMVDAATRITWRHSSVVRLALIAALERATGLPQSIPAHEAAAWAGIMAKLIEAGLVEVKKATPSD